MCQFYNFFSYQYISNFNILFCVNYYDSDFVGSVAELSGK